MPKGNSNKTQCPQEATDKGGKGGKYGDAQSSQQWLCKACGFAKNYDTRKKCWVCQAPRTDKSDKSDKSDKDKSDKDKSGKSKGSAVSFQKMVLEQAHLIAGSESDEAKSEDGDDEHEKLKTSIREEITKIDVVLDAMGHLTDPVCMEFVAQKRREKEAHRIKLNGLKPIKTQVRASIEQRDKIAKKLADLTKEAKSLKILYEDKQRQVTETQTELAKAQGNVEKLTEEQLRGEKASAPPPPATPEQAAAVFAQALPEEAKKSFYRWCSTVRQGDLTPQRRPARAASVSSAASSAAAPTTPQRYDLTPQRQSKADEDTLEAGGVLMGAVTQVIADTQEVISGQGAVDTGVGFPLAKRGKTRRLEDEDPMTDQALDIDSAMLTG